MPSCQGGSLGRSLVTSVSFLLAGWSPNHPIPGKAMWWKESGLYWSALRMGTQICTNLNCSLPQGTATSLIKAMNAAGCLKPKFPFLSVRRSVLLYIGFHLKGMLSKWAPLRGAQHLVHEWQTGVVIISLYGKGQMKHRWKWKYGTEIASF